MIRDEWKGNVQKKIYFMTKNIWNGLNQNDVDRFLSNFKKNQEVGLALMEMLIFYSQEQEVSLAKFLFGQLKRELWLEYIEKEEKYKKDSNFINKYLNSILKETCFIPLEELDPAGSAFGISSIYKRIKDFPKEIEFVQVKEIPLMLAMKKKCIVLFDDVIGTGTQFENFWNKDYHFEKRHVTLNDLAIKNKNTKFFYLVFGANRNKLEELSEKYPDIKIIASELFEPEDSVLNRNNEYWEFNPQIRDEVIQFVAKKINELGINNKFGSNIPVLFQHCRAQNTSLPLYWYSQQGSWQELYKR